MTDEEPKHVGTCKVLGDEYDHPAYGTIRCSRVSGQSRLFGSELVHQHFVQVTISRARKYRSLNEDRIHGNGRLVIEINMSEHQWASFVASMNLGSGVPCTIDSGPPDGTPIEQKPGLIEPNKHDLAKQELADYCKDIDKEVHQRLRELQELAAAPGSISKPALRELVRSLGISLSNFSGNLNFHVEQHTEMMEKNVEAAKSDVEGYIAATAAALGLKELRKMAPRLGFSEPNGMLAIEEKLG